MSRNPSKRAAAPAPEDDNNPLQPAVAAARQLIAGLARAQRLGAQLGEVWLQSLDQGLHQLAQARTPADWAKLPAAWLSQPPAAWTEAWRQWQDAEAQWLDEAHQQWLAASFQLPRPFDAAESDAQAWKAWNGQGEEWLAMGQRWLESLQAKPSGPH